MTPDEVRQAEGRIRRLRPEVVAKIAAGEMILRPLSVAKELVENAIDAGAGRIEVEVREAADRFFSCADDGCGMSPAECRLAVERHATSKLADEEDLLRIRSLGFRGEALPSIARVARLRIVTCDGGEATELIVRGGHQEQLRPAARGKGTTVEVEDLFYNSPVRKRFLRSPAGEVRLIQKLIGAYALAYPGVEFRLLVDGRETMKLPAASPEERLEQVYGPRFREKVLPLRGEHPGIRVRGWVGIPEIARTGTGGQTIVVNGRWVSHPALGHALRQAFGDLIAPARQPFAVLLLEVAGGGVDVNVHPTKREIRFHDDGAVFAEVVRVVRDATRRLVPGMTAQGGRWDAGGYVREEAPNPASLGGLDLLYGPSAGDAPEATGAPAIAAGTPDAWRGPLVPVWQIQDRYILAQTKQGILIVDQHAAHERILYERALGWLAGEQATSQQLLFPAVVQLAPGEYATLESCIEDLPRLGIHLEPFGGDAVILRAVPATWEGDAASMLRDLLDDVADRTRRSEERLQALAASFACHSAIRTGMRLDEVTMNHLIDELFGTRLPHGDPHGRPTYIVLTAEELDRRFGRSG
jgi:DNA mismatch repair protein MutL